MSSTNKTNGINLNSWTQNDIPEMADFNSDNAIIDRAITDHNNNVNIHVTSTERQRWNNSYGIQTYSGDGKSTQSITLNVDFEPRFCIVFATNITPGVIDITNQTHYNYFGIASTGGSNSGLQLSGKTLTVSSSSIVVAKYELRSYNEIGRSYVVLSFR